MRIVAARITPVRLALQSPLATGHGTIAAREGAVVALEESGGARGHGEALPLPGFGLESPDEARAGVTRLAERLIGAEGDDPEALLAPLAREAAATPSARAALDVALHDLAARRDALPLAAWLAKRGGGDAAARMPVAKLVAAATDGAAATQARAAVRAGFATLKLKLGAADFASDLRRVAAVREAVGDGVALRLDANGAWREADARTYLAALAGFGIELLEQPVPARQVAALARLRARSLFPIAADEALCGARAAEALLAAGAADVWVLKPAALGGLAAATRIAALAASADVGVLVTSFLDSALGVSAALHLAASLPGDAPACGLATGELLAADLASGPEPADGALAVPAGPGLGVAPGPEALDRAALGPTRELRL